MASPQNGLGLLLGCVIGTVIGVLPGLGPVATMALLLPFTARASDPLFGLVLLTGVWYGAQYGGTVTSVLVNVPGEAASVMTAIDGYQLARKGRAGAALAVAAVGSFCAGCIALVILQLLAPWVAQAAMRFGPPEYLALMVVAFLLLCNVTGGSFWKSLTSLSFGLILAFVGMDAMSGMHRFTLGFQDLLLGFDLVPIAMGLFGIGEILTLAQKADGKGAETVAIPRLRELYPTTDEWQRSAAPVLRGAGIGFFSGLIPGPGPVTATFLSYSVERRLASDPARFGHGAIEGVAGPESANNAAVIGGLVPLLSLGIPFSAPAALLLAGLRMFNVDPGPLMIAQYPQVFWGVIAAMYLGNLVLVLLNLPLVGIFARLATVRPEILMPAVGAVCLIGVYSLRGSLFDVGVMVAFGLVGWGARKLDYPLAPVVIGLVLGRLTEISFIQTSLMFEGDLTGLAGRPIAVAFLSAAAVWSAWALGKTCVHEARRFRAADRHVERLRPTGAGRGTATPAKFAAVEEKKKGAKDMKLSEAVAIPATTPKPRNRRLTMCLDDGMGPGQMQDIFEAMGEYIDNVRMGRASAMLCPESVVRAKADLCRKFNVDFEAGGPLFEIAKLQNKVDDFFAACRDVGFTSVEISENIFELTPRDLEELFGKARSYGLDSYFEYGRKYPDTESFRLEDAVNRMRVALEAGSRKVIVERAEIDILLAREPDRFVEFVETVGANNLVLEVGPGKPEYPSKLIKMFGTEVNLGNVSLVLGSPDSVFIIENARRGLDRAADYAFIAQGANVATFSFRGRGH